MDAWDGDPPAGRRSGPSASRRGGPPAWRRSSHCSDSSCVEVAWSGEEVLVRDSKDPGGPVLAFSRRQWAAFLDGVRSGEFQDR